MATANKRAVNGIADEMGMKRVSTKACLRPSLNYVSAHPCLINMKNSQNKYDLNIAQKDRLMFEFFSTNSSDKMLPENL